MHNSSFGEVLLWNAHPPASADYGASEHQTGFLSLIVLIAATARYSLICR